MTFEDFCSQVSEEQCKHISQQLLNELTLEKIIEAVERLDGPVSDFVRAKLSSLADVMVSNGGVSQEDVGLLYIMNGLACIGAERLMLSQN